MDIHPIRKNHRCAITDRNTKTCTQSQKQTQTVIIWHTWKQALITHTTINTL